MSAFACTDLSQVQCIKSYQSQEHDELTLEKADILQAVTITSDGKENHFPSSGYTPFFPLKKRSWSTAKKR